MQLLLHIMYVPHPPAHLNMHTHGNLVRIFVLFHLPVTIFSCYQMIRPQTHASRSSIALAGLSFTGLSILIPLRVTLTTTNKLYDERRTLDASEDESCCSMPPRSLCLHLNFRLFRKRQKDPSRAWSSIRWRLSILRVTQGGTRLDRFTRCVCVHTAMANGSSLNILCLQSFSSIVGPNGSGKSNAIDALLFVFGYRASKMRQGILSELIHNSA
jgi:hypothetical protein